MYDCRSSQYELPGYDNAGDNKKVEKDLEMGKLLLYTFKNTLPTPFVNSTFTDRPLCMQARSMPFSTEHPSGNPPADKTCLLLEGKLTRRAAVPHQTCTISSTVWAEGACFCTETGFVNGIVLADAWISPQNPSRSTSGLVDTTVT